MKYKVVQTKQGKVGVDESADIKEQDYCDYPPFGIGQIKNIDNELCFVTIPIKSEGSLTQRLYQCKDECQKVIASINHSISLNVPMVIVEDEAAQQKDVYSEDDLRKAMLHSSNCNSSLIGVNNYIKQLKQEYIELETSKVLKNKCIKCGLNLIESEGSTPICNEYECLGIVLATKTLEEFSNEEKIKTNIVDGQLIAYVKK